MDRYVLFVNTATDYLMFPLKAFIGAKYASDTTIDLYFEKAPLSFKVTLTIESGTGVEVSLKISELFSRNSSQTIIFNDTVSTWPFEEVTGIASFTKVVIK
jgi:hypothetical protein|tara:strand:- start:799 stop:1101 length:303 start_codon:yes stop_codon:yes gene_type:complete